MQNRVGLSGGDKETEGACCAECARKGTACQGASPFNAIGVGQSGDVGALRHTVSAFNRLSYWTEIQNPHSPQVNGIGRYSERHCKTGYGALVYLRYWMDGGHLYALSTVGESHFRTPYGSRFWRYNGNVNTWDRTETPPPVGCSVELRGLVGVGQSDEPLFGKAPSEAYAPSSWVPIAAGIAAVAAGIGLAYVVTKPSRHTNRLMNPLTGKKLYIYRVPLDRGGYTKQGRYFGVGVPLFRVIDDENGKEEYVRAASKSEAKLQFPHAKFFP